MDRFRQSSKTDDSSLVKEVMDEEWLRLSEENCELPQWRPRRETCTPFSEVSAMLNLDFQQAIDGLVSSGGLPLITIKAKRVIGVPFRG